MFFGGTHLEPLPQLNGHCTHTALIHEGMTANLANFAAGLGEVWHAEAMKNNTLEALEIGHAG